RTARRGCCPARTDVGGREPSGAAPDLPNALAVRVEPDGQAGAGPAPARERHIPGQGVQGGERFLGLEGLAVFSLQTPDVVDGEPGVGVQELPALLLVLVRVKRDRPSAPAEYRAGGPVAAVGVGERATAELLEVRQ